MAASELKYVSSDESSLQEEYRLRPQFRKCTKCNVMFGSNEQLAVHISTAHKNTQTWSCMAHQTCPMVRKYTVVLRHTSR